MLCSLIKYLRRPALQTHYPSLSSDCIAEVMLHAYGLKVQVKSLNAFIQGQNFLLNDGKRKYVFKVVVQTAGKDFESAHTAVFDYLAERDKGERFQQNLRNKWGECITKVGLRDKTVEVRVLSFLEGTLIGDLEDKRTIDYQRIGKLIGQMDQWLEGFYHEGLRGREQNDEWSMFSINRVVEQYSKYIKNKELKEVVHRLSKEFQQKVLSNSSEFKSQVIHHDCNEYNLVAQGGEYGLIDFGDMMYSPRIFELGVAVAYCLINVPGEDRDRMGAAENLVKGYHEVVGLEPRELEVLVSVSAARLVTTICVTAYNRVAQPDNQYLFAGENEKNSALMVLSRVCPAHFTTIFP